MVADLLNPYPVGESRELVEEDMDEAEGDRPIEEPLTGRGRDESSFLSRSSLSLAAILIGRRLGRAAGAGEEALMTTTGCGLTTAMAFR